jgi:hypothetical protein
LLSAACSGLPLRYRTNLGLFHDAPVIQRLLIVLRCRNGIHLSAMALSSCHRLTALHARMVRYVGYELCQSLESILAKLAIKRIHLIISKVNGLPEVVEDLTFWCVIPT